MTNAKTNIDVLAAALVGAEIDRIHQELTDKELVAQYNAYRKRRMKLDLDSAMLDAQIVDAGRHIQERACVYVGDDGIAIYDEAGQPSLFSVSIEATQP